MNTPGSHKLEHIIQRIADMSRGRERVSVDDILEVIGRRTFGPLLVFIGLFLAIPGAGDIPGVPIASGLIIILTVGQQLIGRNQIWLPQWLLRRSVQHEYVEKTMAYAKKPAKIIDDWTTNRLDWFVSNRISRYLSSVACLSIALLTPAMEIVFFSANVAGVCLFLFGLAYLTHDGLVMLISFTLYFGLMALIVFGLLI